MEEKKAEANAAATPTSKTRRIRCGQGAQQETEDESQNECPFGTAMSPTLIQVKFQDPHHKGDYDDDKTVDPEDQADLNEANTHDPYLEDEGKVTQGILPSPL
ncbi:hypothetical protein NDU88_005678 [Pleurodeles waltl]|uniref:Uncharacterized protein n=1 Tax=Pleurodeles waltl TaxID=8319 RepID=A0AAV7TBA8_PLEWA|nr:hypothetical protein NDU88_005678 [Pleurodeles waltl]